MKRYEVTLKRKQTLNSEQNARQRRETVFAETAEEAKSIALATNHNGKYFTVERVVSR